MFGWFPFQNIDFELAGEKFVLPFVYPTPGGSALLAGLFAPAVTPRASSCISLQNLTDGIVGIGIAIATGTVAYRRCAIVTILDMAALNIGSIVCTGILPTPDTVRRY
jgi:hypothetical protein